MKRSALIGDCFMCYFGTRDSLFPTTKVPWEIYFLRGWNNGQVPTICSSNTTSEEPITEKLHQTFSDITIFDKITNL